MVFQNSKLPKKKKKKGEVAMAVALTNKIHKVLLKTKNKVTLP